MVTGTALRELPGDGRRVPLGSLAVLGGCLLAVAGATLTDKGLKFVAPAVVLAVIGTVWHRQLLQWRALLSTTILVVLFIPLRRYSLPASLPIQLEPYRLIAAFVFFAWFTSLLIDPRVRPRRSGLGTPIAAYVAVVIASLLANPTRVHALSSIVTKKLTFFGSFFVLFFVIVSCCRRFEDIERLIKVLVLGSCVVAFFGIVQSRTGFNLFDHIPLLRRGALPLTTGDFTAISRGGHIRAYASAQHPIALGAALALVTPLAVGVAAYSKRRIWWGAPILLLLGAIASVSRTAMLMYVVIAIVFFWLRPVHVKRMWPLLLPGLVVIHIAVPGTIGGLTSSFFPKGGLVAQQTNAAVGSGRLATLGPALHTEFRPDPLLGEGFSTRIVDPLDGPVNAPILDDQWAGVACETGILGMVTLLWIFFRFIRRTGRAAKNDLSPRGWLLVGFASAAASFLIGMATFDAFSFIQVTILFFVCLALGSALLRLEPETALHPAPAI
jgi:hypothetical protein